MRTALRSCLPLLPATRAPGGLAKNVARETRPILPSTTSAREDEPVSLQLDQQPLLRNLYL